MKRRYYVQKTEMIEVDEPKMVLKFLECLKGELTLPPYFLSWPMLGAQARI